MGVASALGPFDRTCRGPFRDARHRRDAPATPRRLKPPRRQRQNQPLPSPTRAGTPDEPTLHRGWLHLATRPRRGVAQLRRRLRCATLRPTAATDPRPVRQQRRPHPPTMTAALLALAGPRPRRGGADGGRRGISPSHTRARPTTNDMGHDGHFGVAVHRDPGTDKTTLMLAGDASAAAARTEHSYGASPPTGTSPTPASPSSAAPDANTTSYTGPSHRLAGRSPSVPIR